MESPERTIPVPATPLMMYWSFRGCVFKGEESILGQIVCVAIEEVLMLGGFGGCWVLFLLFSYEEGEACALRYIENRPYITMTAPIKRAPLMSVVRETYGFAEVCFGKTCGEMGLVIFTY